MTGWISEIRMLWHDQEEEVHYWPAPDDHRTYVTLNEILENNVTDLEFHVTEHGLTINVTDMNNEVVGTITETFEEIVARLTGESQCRN